MLSKLLNILQILQKEEKSKKTDLNKLYYQTQGKNQQLLAEGRAKVKSKNMNSRARLQYQQGNQSIIKREINVNSSNEFQTKLEIMRLYTTRHNLSVKLINNINHLNNRTSAGVSLYKGCNSTSAANNNNRMFFQKMEDMNNSNYNYQQQGFQAGNSLIQNTQSLQTTNASMQQGVFSPNVFQGGLLSYEQSKDHINYEKHFIRDQKQNKRVNTQNQYIPKYELDNGKNISQFFLKREKEKANPRDDEGKGYASKIGKINISQIRGDNRMENSFGDFRQNMIPRSRIIARRDALKNSTSPKAFSFYSQKGVTEGYEKKNGNNFHCESVLSISTPNHNKHRRIEKARGSVCSFSNMAKDNLTTQDSHRTDEETEMMSEIRVKEKNRPKQVVQVKDFGQLKQKLLQKVDRIMTQQSIEGNMRTKPSNQIQRGIVQKGGTQLLLKESHAEEKVRFKLENLVKLKRKVRMIRQKRQRSSSSSKNNSDEKEEDDDYSGRSLSSNSVLTDELEDVEQYKKRRKIQRVKFHRVHVKRINKEKRRYWEEYSDDREGENNLSENRNELGEQYKDKLISRSKLKNTFESTEKREEKAENFSIYGSFQDFSGRVKEKLRDRISQLKPCRDIISFVTQESKNIQHKITSLNQEKNQELERICFRNLSENTIQVISKLIPLFSEGMQNITDRDILDAILNHIHVEVTKGKNLVVQLICLRAQAKIIKLNKNYMRAIELYKQCKNQANTQHLISYRLNAYKNIAFCFSKQKAYDFAHFYYRKMLRLAWYLNNKDLELQAYDLIGLQYFYEGKISQAEIFHNKMVIGDYEPNESNVRRLAISQIDTKFRHLFEGSTVNASSHSLTSGTKSFKKIMQRIKLHDPNLDKSQDFYISSDSDDDLDLHITPVLPTHGKSTSNRDQEQLHKQTEQPSSPTEKRRFKKHEPMFHHKDAYHTKHMNEEANKNIMLGSVFQKKRILSLKPLEPLDSTAFKPSKTQMQSSLRINHLSVNRELGNYQVVDRRIAKDNNFQFNEQMYDQQDKNNKHKIKVIFQDLADNLLFAMANLELLINKQTNQFNRKLSFCIPQYSPQINHTLDFSNISQQHPLS